MLIDLEDSIDGPFIQLVDKSGWSFEQVYNEQVAEKVPLEVGFWSFYVDNYPNNIALRQHPTDNNGVNFYCVQAWTDEYLISKENPVC